MSKSNRNIIVPEAFPSILKTYAKDALRTQPYDLLTWSAAYFRCIANDIEPPVKLRFEENTQQMADSRSLTKEYIKVLIKQIGKGYFVERRVLESRWKALGLSEDDLLLFLNECGMLQWQRIHWLELLSVMIASLCTDFESSMNLLCELLSDNPEGAPKVMPIWMFETCYSFLAQLDGTLENANISNINSQPFEPAQINAQAFRDGLLEEWKSCVKFSAMQNDGDETISPISAQFDRMRTALTFTEMIQSLTDVCSTENSERSAYKFAADSKWKYEIIRRIGAPWSWIYQFVNQCRPSCESYNFYECAHKINNTEALEDFMDVNVSSMNMTGGVGPSIPSEISNTFLNFMKTKAIQNEGIVSSDFFSKENCPRMQ